MKDIIEAILVVTFIISAPTIFMFVVAAILLVVAHILDLLE